MSRSNINNFSLSINFYLSVDGKFDYTKDYMSNIARIITRKYPSFHLHKKSEEIIKAYIISLVTRKVEGLCGSGIENLSVTDIREISEMVAEYEGQAETTSRSATVDNPSFNDDGLELSMTVDTGSSDIQSIAFDKPKFHSANEVNPTSKPQIRKRTVIRVSVSLEVRMETKLYLFFIQELPELFSLKELDCLRVRIHWQQTGARFMEESGSVTLKTADNSRFVPWLIALFSLMTLCLIGLTSLFFVVPDLYKQDIHFMRRDTIHQSISIQDSRVEWENVSFPESAKDTIIVIDKKKVVVR